MKTGLILEGGAVRGIFTAGVLDRLMENGIYYPYVCGVSAGGGNAMSYVSRQIGRTAADKRSEIGILLRIQAVC